MGIPAECDVTIEVADDAGAPLFLAEVHMPAGWQKLGFSGRDALGRLLPNGIYYYTLTADGTSRTTRVVVKQPGELPRSQGKAVRVRDERPKTR